MDSCNLIEALHGGIVSVTDAEPFEPHIIIEGKSFHFPGSGLQVIRYEIHAVQKKTIMQ